MNEIEYFLNSKIKFLDIPRIIKKVMEEHSVQNNLNIDSLVAIDLDVRDITRKIIESNNYD